MPRHETEWKSHGARWLGRDARFLDGEPREEELAVRHGATDGNRAKRHEVKPGPLSCGEDHVRSHTLLAGSRSPAGALRGNNKGVKFRNERQSVGFIVRKRTGFAFGRRKEQRFGLVICSLYPVTFFVPSNFMVAFSQSTIVSSKVREDVEGLLDPEYFQWKN